MSETDSHPRSIVIYVDADACPVKPEVYHVAERYNIKVVLVANRPIHIPYNNHLIERITVGTGLDVADDWIAGRSRPGCIVVTADVPLAARAVAAGAVAITPKGKIFTAENVGEALATRNLMDHLRSSGQITGGPSPFTPRDRSAFLSALDLAIVRLRREGFGA